MFNQPDDSTATLIAQNKQKAAAVTNVVSA